jgi:hypothetical protein
MKKIISVLLLAAVAYAPAWACDVCGCSSSSQFLGVLPGYSYNFIGLQYLHADYTSTHPGLRDTDPMEHAADHYNTLQLWGRYNIGKKYQVFLFVPYQFNYHHADSGRYDNSGIGDITVMANRKLLDKESCNISHLLTGGVGIKLPSGHHDGISILDKEGLPNMQPGTGARDLIVSTNYTLRYKKLGFNADASYTLTTTSSDSYKYGNKLNSGLLGFYALAAGRISMMPVTGVRYEYTLHDYDNYRKKWLNEQSGGYMVFAAAGVQAYYKKVGARVTGQLPMAQHYAAGNVTASYKLETNIFFLF